MTGVFVESTEAFWIPLTSCFRERSRWSEGVLGFLRQKDFLRCLGENTKHLLVFVVVFSWLWRPSLGIMTSSFMRMTKPLFNKMLVRRVLVGRGAMLSWLSFLLSAFPVTESFFPPKVRFSPFEDFLYGLGNVFIQASEELLWWYGVHETGDPHFLGNTIITETFLFVTFYEGSEVFIFFLLDLVKNGCIFGVPSFLSEIDKEAL